MERLLVELVVAKAVDFVDAQTIDVTLETVERASEIDLPRRRIGYVAMRYVFARVDGPLLVERRVARDVVRFLFSMDPRHTEHELIASDPFETVNASLFKPVPQPRKHSLFFRFHFSGCTNARLGRRDSYDSTATVRSL